MTKHGESAGGPGPTVFVLFGATGDLARRLVLPAFYRLAREGLLPGQWLLVGNGRGDVAHEDFRARVRGALAEFGPEPEPREWDAFAERVVLRRRRVQRRQPRGPARRARQVPRCAEGRPAAPVRS
jgi:glucose-6-phosphate 1-dehydrogenase